MSLRRLVAATAAAVAVVSSTGAVAAASVPSGPSATVTVFLTAPDQAGLRQLAEAHGISRAQRFARLEALLPGAAQTSAVRGYLSSRGLRVLHTSPWSVTATGASSAVTAAFGSSYDGQLAVPSGLAGLADLVAVPQGGRLHLRPLATPRALSGGDLRNAYTASGVTPPDGSAAATPLTVATVQFAPWDDTDLTTYASAHGITVRTGQYTPVDIDGGAQPDPTNSGASEVALDQESLLATAPYANQRAYFAPNDTTGASYLDALSQVVADAPTDGIVALSTSWGDCESDWSPSYISEAEKQFVSLAAAGVTVFAASGDSGVYDCGDSTASVDYPASSPEVVGVGGTSLTGSGTSWAETSWACDGYDGFRDPNSCVAHGGSGGGASSVFAEPVWQQHVANLAYARAGHRLVPDIAADADPDTGFEVDGKDACGGAASCQFGGTSLAAPVSAALLTDALMAAGRTTGLGDIHPALYSAPAADVRDVTTGANGAASATAGTADPSVAATRGYDTVTGVGAVLWSGLVTALLDPAATPATAAAFGQSSPHASRSYLTVAASWLVGQSTSGVAAQSAHVTITQLRGRTVLLSSSAVGSDVFTATPGATYTMTVTPGATWAGVSGGSGYSKTFAVPVDDRSFAKHGTWTAVASTTAYGGSYLQSASSGAYLTVTATGTHYDLVVRTGPSFGRLSVAVGSARAAVYDLYSAAPGTRVLVLAVPSSTTVAARTLTLRQTGTKNVRSRGTAVTLDELAVTG